MDLTQYNNLDIILVCGLPGSGKSHFSKASFKDSGHKRVNRKEIRGLLYEMSHFGEPWSEELFSETDESIVKHVERKILEHLLQKRQKVLIDNTSVTVSSRKTYINLAKQMNRSIGVIFLNIPLIKCLQRNRSRQDRIPDTVISNLSATIELPKKEEGFKQVLIIDNY